MNIFFEILIVLASYLMGSIPFGFIFTRRATGKNILHYGSGNIGSTNVGRIASKKVSLLTQLCDMSKGILPVAMVYILQHNLPGLLGYHTIYMVALSSILGHNYSLFLKFKGGKGVNTTLGASLLLAPWSVCLSVIIYFLVKWQTSYVSLGSICLGICLPLIDLAFHNSPFPFYYLVACAFMIVVRHIPNIKRLMEGTENKTASI